MATKRDSMEPTALDVKNQSIFVQIHETRLPCETAADWQTQQQTTSWATEDELKILMDASFRAVTGSDFEKHRNAAQCFSARLSSPEATSIFLDEVVNLHRGQGLDLYWRDSSICPSQEQYLEMVKNKTGGLFRLLSRLMLAEASVSSAIDAEDTLIRFFNITSMVFQVLDDYKNLCSSSYTATKGFAEDLTEGKFSFPVICALNANKEHALGSVVRNVLKTRTSNDAVKLGTIRTIETMGGFDRTREVLKSLLDVAHALLGDLELHEGSQQCCHVFRQMLLKLHVFDQ
ncbi:hypothetical protein CBER1_10251 [Cercospora berteroae]|uniref:Geranylgeranyl pyrophosphate synthase n=1 Tax=Cercospora berteroae TaxID=357750 RepID=A0A2S6BYG6_9PEZI|nr:hypothetical protein CBER1_10251 [Cercospora berteroae]